MSNLGVLGKDLFDIDRSRTHTKIEFGADCYWVEDWTEVPYGAVLTEVLNFDPAPTRETLDRLERVVTAQDEEVAPRVFMDLVKMFASLPLYRFYLEDFREAASWPIEHLVVGGARDAFARDILNRAYQLPEIVERLLEEIAFIQQRYGWFLDKLFSGPQFEKKKGQRKVPLARMICDQFLEPFVSGVSLGEDLSVDAPPVNIQYALRNRSGQEPEIVEKLYFDRLVDFVYVEFMRGLQKGFVPKRCASCGRWFLQMPGTLFSYCDGPAPGQAGKTCREVGATASFQNKVRNNEIWQLHQRAYKKYYARVIKKTMGKQEFEAWARNAERLRDQALEEYERVRKEDQPGIVEGLKKELNML